MLAARASWRRLGAGRAAKAPMLRACVNNGLELRQSVGLRDFVKYSAPTVVLLHSDGKACLMLEEKDRNKQPPALASAMMRTFSRFPKFGYLPDSEGWKYGSITAAPYEGFPFCGEKE